jgi:hypothetical protein
VFESGREDKRRRKRKNLNVRGVPILLNRFLYEVETDPSSHFVMTTRLAQKLTFIHLDLNVTIKIMCHLFLPKSLTNLSFVCSIQIYVASQNDKLFVYDFFYILM